MKSSLENYQEKTLELREKTQSQTDSFQGSVAAFKEGEAHFDANVLVVEDNIINQKLIKRTLEDLGLHVALASNGLEAFQKRKDGDFDLIFMDIQMPLLDGVEATKEILAWEEEFNKPHVPIVALTANALHHGVLNAIDQMQFLRTLGENGQLNKQVLKPEQAC